MSIHSAVSAHARNNPKLPRKRDNYKQAQVLDVNQALSDVNKEQSKLEREQLKLTRKAMDPVLKRVPQLKLYAESQKIFPDEEYEAVNLELCTLQMVLSRILQEVMTIKAANI